MHSIKISGYRIGIKFDKDLYTYSKSYRTKQLFEQNCKCKFLFGATSLVKYSDKEMYVYSCYRITFDSAGSCSFDNAPARKVIIFGVDKSSSSHSDDCKNIFLVLDEGPTFRINRSFGSAEKKGCINFSKTNTNFTWVCFIMLLIVICLLMEKKSSILKPIIKMLTFQLNFVLEVYLINLLILSLEKYL